MEELEKQLDAVFKAREEMLKGTVKEDDLKEVIQVVLALIEKTKSELSQNMAINKGISDDNYSGLLADLNTMEERMKAMHTKMTDKLTGDNSKLKAQLLKEVQFVRDLIPTIPSFQPLEDRISEVESKIPEIPPELSNFQVRDKLESIKDNADKLEIDAIKDLRKELDELKKKWTSRPIFGGGGFSKIAWDMHYIDDETPTNTGDDLSFTLAHIPSPTSSLKVYRNGARQRITEDYTFTGQTLTLLNALGASEILLVDYKI